jgi:PBP1b-binding outer membrane lipoprotein LpoB
MPESNRIYRNARLYVTASLVGAMLLLAGCVTAPAAPTASLNEAKAAIQAAEKDDASHFAAAELDEARQKLKLAEKAVVAEDMVLAMRYADESAATAKLAAARTEASKAVAINEELSRGAEALMQEMKRAGDQQ